MNIREKIRSFKSPIGGGGGVHGSDILDALKSTADRRRKIFRDKTFVPDHYTVGLSDRDFSFLKTFLKALESELLEEMTGYLRKKRYQINSASVRIRIKAGHTLKPGELEISGRYESNEPREFTEKERKIKLKLFAGPHKDEVFELAEGSHVIGRGRDADLALTIKDMLVSKRHCRIDVRQGEVFLRDQESSNGTFLNDRIISSEERIRPGDHIRIGNTSIEALF